MLAGIKRQYLQYKAKSIDNLYLQEYLRTPKFNRATDYRQLEFLALDLEMTSLDVKTGEIVSIGFVPIVGGEIDIAQGFSALVRNTQTVGESATIHGICDRDAARGMAVEDIFPPLFEALRGRVLLLHHAKVDLAFLDHYSRKIFGVPFAATVVDTMALELRRLKRRQPTILPGQVRLYQCRERYGLPEYRAHDAYTDALATAELFLAQAAAIADRGALPLRQLL